MQWLGKDNLSKYKTLDPAVNFVRAKLMEGRSQSADNDTNEAEPDFTDPDYAVSTYTS
jgi:hypothetical protein